MSAPTAIGLQGRATRAAVVARGLLVAVGLAAASVRVDAMPPVPQTIGSVRLSGPVESARVSADGKTVLVQMRKDASHPASLQIVDAADPAAPKVRGRLALDGNGEMAMDAAGHFALLNFQPTAPADSPFGPATVLGIDLSQPAQPKVVWRLPMTGRVLLAPLATRFATVPASHDWNGMTTTVRVITSADRGVRTVDVGLRSPENWAFSPSGDRLALLESSGFSVVDLAPNPARVLTQDDGSFLPPRHGTGCLAVLNAGDILVESPRVPNALNRYRDAPGLPRATSIGFAGSLACPALNAQEADRSPLVFASDLGDLRAFDVRPDVTPSTSLVAHVPGGQRALAKAGDLLFVTSDDGLLSVLDLRQRGTLAADWPRLLHAHADAMALLAKTPPSGRWEATEAILSTLERAGVGDLLDAPLGATPARRAAAVFNDYAFLANEQGHPRDVTERILRRVLALDPDRAVAHLNLADEMRSHLDEGAANGADAAARLSEITTHYRAYLALGGKSTPALQRLAAGDPARNTRDTCAAIAAWADAGRLSDLTSNAGSRLDLHGRSVDIAFGVMGTAHAASWLITDANDGSLLTDAQLSPELGQLQGEDGVQLLSLRGQHYIVSERGDRPMTLYSMKDNAPVCRFTMRTTETVGPAAVERPLCESLIGGRAPASIAFDAPSTVDETLFDERWNQSRPVGMASVDYLNDGTPLNVCAATWKAGRRPDAAATSSTYRRPTAGTLPMVRSATS